MSSFVESGTMCGSWPISSLLVQALTEGFEPSINLPGPYGRHCWRGTPLLKANASMINNTLGCATQWHVSDWNTSDFQQPGSKVEGGAPGMHLEEVARLGQQAVETTSTCKGSFSKKTKLVRSLLYKTTDAKRTWHRQGLDKDWTATRTVENSGHRELEQEAVSRPSGPNRRRGKSRELNTQSVTS